MSFIWRSKHFSLRLLCQLDTQGKSVIRRLNESLWLWCSACARIWIEVPVRQVLLPRGRLSDRAWTWGFNGGHVCTMDTCAHRAQPSWSPTFQAKSTELMLRVISAGKCPDVNMAMTSGNTSLRMEGRYKVVFDIDLYVNKTLTTITKVTCFKTGDLNWKWNTLLDIFLTLAHRTFTQSVINQTRCQDFISRSTCRQGELLTFKTNMCLHSLIHPWCPGQLS